MKSVLLRPSSVQSFPGSPAHSFSLHDSVFSSRTISVNLRVNNRMTDDYPIRRSESSGVSNKFPGRMSDAMNLVAEKQSYDPRIMENYYEEMLKLNPGDSLLLRNYAKFLYEVEQDVSRAEEYYGRAILASPGDGDVLCLYAKLIWETERDEKRAKSYFDQAVHASPDDCVVLGSYARFMWEVEEDEEDEQE